MYNIKHGSATDTHNYFQSNTMDLGIFDPPFGIDESSFDKHYKRNKNIIPGYIEAPNDYLTFTHEWLKSVLQVMKQNSSIYIISGWTNLEFVLTAARLLNLKLENHIIWKYNFGVFTKKKFVSSHYHILYYKIGNPVFNTYVRYTQFDKTDSNKSVLYQDLEDVWSINKAFAQGELKNVNKLPDELIQKIILYSSNPEHNILDTFQGNFTTAINTLRLGRYAYGLELNESAYDIGIKKLQQVKFGDLLDTLPKDEKSFPKNQGKSVSTKEYNDIRALVTNNIKIGMTKRKAIEEAMNVFERGYFSILNIVND